VQAVPGAAPGRARTRRALGLRAARDRRHVSLAQRGGRARRRGARHARDDRAHRSPPALRIPLPRGSGERHGAAPGRRRAVGDLQQLLGQARGHAGARGGGRLAGRGLRGLRSSGAARVRGRGGGSLRRRGGVPSLGRGRLQRRQSCDAALGHGARLFALRQSAGAGRAARAGAGHDPPGHDRSSAPGRGPGPAVHRLDGRGGGQGGHQGRCGGAAMPGAPRKRRRRGHQGDRWIAPRRGSRGARVPRRAERSVRCRRARAGALGASLDQESSWARGGRRAGRAGGGHAFDDGRARAMRRAFAGVLATLALGVLAGFASAAGPVREVVWVRFADHGALDRGPKDLRRDAARAALSPQSWARRARRTGFASPPTFENDLPVEPGYVAALQAHGIHVRVVSRWLNAASVEATSEQMSWARVQPFVLGLELVAQGRRMEPEPDEASPAAGAVRARPMAALAPGDPAFYGASAAQIRLIQIDKLHAQGLSGNGVLIAMLDTGFRETHVVFDSLAVQARRDFVYGDTVVANETGQDIGGQDTHGTQTLSVVGAYLPGTLVGAAYRAHFALAKTEDLAIEQPIEMDWWQAAAEWADSLGADVISSSLGYTTFTPPTGFYSYGDLDGRTTVITRAAEEAARRGILVVTAQGNEGATPWHYLGAPADAESACAVGAADSLGVVQGFSSFGPSADGRVKPDVCAMGRACSLVSPGDDFALRLGSGTSFSTPAVAGLAALLLEAHPA